jgi:hypothetical protein
MNTLEQIAIKVNPLDFAITNDFLSSSTDDKRLFLDGLTPGYSTKEISKHTQIQYSRFPSIYPSNNKPYH